MENSKGEDKSIDLTENDLVFITNESMTESTSYGDEVIDYIEKITGKTVTGGISNSSGFKLYNELDNK